MGAALLAAAPTLAADDPILWPEPQRAFLQDGPGLLLTKEQEAELLTLDEAGRDTFIERFLADPIPETPVNELREGIELRKRLAFEEHSPSDARGHLLFLQGPPAEKLVIDCGNAFKPLEIWTYGAVPNQRRLILFRPSPDEPFRLWLPIDSKRALYTDQMAGWLDQWETLGIGGKRIDRHACPTSLQVDEATGIDGLRGKVVASAGGINRRSDGNIQEQPYAAFRWSRPRNRANFLVRPADLAAWARAAMATRLGPPPPRLALESLDLDFPDKQGQRLVTRILVGLAPPGADGGVALVNEDGKDRIKLTVEGTIEREGQSFEEFRMRFRLPRPDADGLVALLLERRLRPEQPFLLRMKVRDEVSGAETRVARGFLVPEKPEARLARASTLSAAQGEMIPLTLAGKDSLILVPPIDEVVLGTWRADAMVNGDRIVKVVFLVDGEAQFSRAKPPYSAEVRLASAPREQVVKVEGYDEAGELVASDEVMINQTRGAFRVMITEPAEGARIGRRVKVRAEVAVPDENRVELVELKVNDRTVTTLSAPPWQADVDVPDEPIVHLTVLAQLDDGRRTETVRFLRAPENLEQVDVNLVELFATVTDGGNLVRGLSAGDFEVLESGKPQTVSRFEMVENLPLTLGFVIDTSTSMASSLVEAQRAADGFLRKLKAKDRAFGVGFSTRPYLAMPPTDDLEAVSESLEGMRAAGRTALYDGLITALYYFRGYRGQRALILLTDGEDTGSNTPWQRALEYAQRSGVAIYAIGLNVPVLSFEVRGQLSTLSESTGGKVYFVERAEELAEIYGEIEHELRSRYYLAYESEKPADEYGYRPVEVRVKRGGKVRTARGYYP
ncbi:MAG TPA: VWA domain-containing protein [Thermoanaerobaculia bacterium]|nr:VWA domain-containing protein [Thermoanaerobaculia bacterium]